MNYNIFIDESGIHKKIDHSSFVVVYIDVDDQDVVNEKVEEIEEKLKISSFHWSDYSSRHKWEIRKDFIREISRLPFLFKYIIIKNPIDPQKELHNSIVTMVTETTVNTVYVDGKYPKLHTQTLHKILRDRGLSIRNLKTVNDASFPAIRIADAPAGLIRAYHDTYSRDTTLLYKLVLHKMRNPPF